MSDDNRKDALQDDIVAFDNYMEVVADTSVQELTTEPSSQPTSPAVKTSCPADSEDGVGWCKRFWRRIYRLLSSSVGLSLLLVIYTVLGAVLLNYTEHDREKEMHAELDAIRRRVVADIVNITASRSRDARIKSRDLSDVTLEDAVEALVIEYGDARESLRPSSSSPGWTFTGAVYFCCTVYTTIGYGNVSPVTTTGRVITIIYALIGIPLCLVVLATVGKLLTRAIKFLWMFVRRFYYTGSCRRVRRMIPVSRLRMTLLQRIGNSLRRRTGRFRQAVRRRKSDQPTDSENETCIAYEVDDEFNLPPVVAVIIGISYTLLGGLMYMSWEHWSYFEAFYFTCISLSTIGFGDVVPDHHRFFMASSVYMVVGLALLAMIINVLMAAMHVTIRRATTHVTRVIEEVEQRLADRDDSEVVEPEIIISETQQQQQQSAPPPSHSYSPPLLRRRSI